MRRGAFTLRRAGPGDAEAAAGIIAAALAEHALVFDPAGRDADVATFGARADAFDLVAEADGAVVGLVSLGPHGSPGVGWISKLFVARDARRAGIGRALLAAAHDEARRRGLTSVGLRSRRVFEAALALYAAEGYRGGDDPEAQERGDVVLYRAL